MTKNQIIVFGSLFCAYALSGCAGAQVALSKKNLDVQTKMSATLFIDPLEDESQKTFFLQAKNTSDKDFELNEELRRAIAARGFKPVSNPKLAHYVLQVNVLQVGKSDPTAAEATMYKGYGWYEDRPGSYEAHTTEKAAYAGGMTDQRSITGLGLVGELGGFVGAAMIKDVYFAVITDLQIKERLGKGQTADNSTDHYNKSGTSGGTRSSFSEKSEWRISQTRILSSANKVNLDFAQAQPELKRALVQSISNIF